MFTHTQLLISCFSFSNAFLFRSSSERPRIWPQNPSADRCTCLDKARAPTVNFGGFGLPSSCFALKIVYLLLKLSKTELRGGGQTSLDPCVLRMPNHVKKPLGLSATKKSLISTKRFWLSLFSKASKMSPTSGPSLFRVSTSKWVSSSSRPGHSLYFIGKIELSFQRTKTTQKSFKRLPLG